MYEDEHLESDYEDKASQTGTYYPNDIDWDEAAESLEWDDEDESDVPEYPDICCQLVHSYGYHSVDCRLRESDI